MTRDEFRDRVFERDNYKCVICKEPAVDAHHIMERRLWEDGGYYLNNGASLCSSCHIKAEQTEISPQQLWIPFSSEKILPSHLYKDTNYDKWGNVILPNGTRLKGELFYDESVQKILKPILHLFTDYVKYPRTYHVPWSKLSKDDRYIKNMDGFKNHRVIVTEKMDGENTTMYQDHIHARSLEKISGKNYSRILLLWEKIRHDISPDIRICGENVLLKHTIKYEILPSPFLCFSIWRRDICLDWDSTLEIAELLDIKTVPIIYDGIYDEDLIKSIQVDGVYCEGYVIRKAAQFTFLNFKNSVVKYVSPNFVLPPEHWSKRQQFFNSIKE